jgi:predicted methyltransferase
MNDLMSMGLHRAWKAYTVLVANVREGQQVLDIAGGTGDLARAFARRVGPAGEVVHRHQRGHAAHRPRPLAGRRAEPAHGGV